MTILPGNAAPRQVEKGLEKLLSVQRPVVLAHIRSIRSRSPQASPAQVIATLERRYLAAVTTGGAAVGASSAIPAVGVGVSLALSAVETAGFLEASALFAQSITEVHGFAVDDPERARTLVMTMMMGPAGADLLKQLAGQATGKGASRPKFWGELVTKSLPEAALNQITSRIERAFLRKFATSQGASAVGRMVPFGVGAVIGGAGNHLLGRKVVASSRTAFPPAPAEFPEILAPRLRQPGDPTLASRAGNAGRQVGSGVTRAGRAIGSGAASLGRSISDRARRRLPGGDWEDLYPTDLED